MKNDSMKDRGGPVSAALTTALAPETRARATAVAGTIRADGATVAAKLLLEAAGSGRDQRTRGSAGRTFRDAPDRSRG